MTFDKVHNMTLKTTGRQKTATVEIINNLPESFLKIYIFKGVLWKLMQILLLLFLPFFSYSRALCWVWRKAAQFPSVWGGILMYVNIGQIVWPLLQHQWNIKLESKLRIIIGICGHLLRPFLSNLPLEKDGKDNSTSAQQNNVSKLLLNEKPNLPVPT